MSSFPSQYVTIAQPSADADLLLRIGIALSIRRRAGWHLVRFGVHNGVVKLAGIVPTFYDRQLIAALARRVAGVRRIEDELAVGDPSLRQEVTETESASGQFDGNTVKDASRNRFSHLPVVADSLEDLTAQQVADDGGTSSY